MSICWNFHFKELNLQQAISLCRTEEQKSLLSDGEEQESSDESEHDNWNNEIRYNILVLTPN